MSKSRPRHHTVLPESQLRDYFSGKNGFAVYDIHSGDWSRKGPKSFCVARGYYDDDHEETLMKIESAAIRPIRKLARREMLDDTERWDVAEYVIASLFRNSATIDRVIAESIEEIKESLPSELSARYPGVPEAYALERIEANANDESFIRQIRGDGAKRSEIYPELVERVYRLCWHIITVERPPTYFLLTDHPFQYGPLGNDEGAWIGFPISSEVLLYMNNVPGNRWLAYPMKRNHVVDYGRNLVDNPVARYVAVPREDAKLTKMIRRIRPIGL